MLLWRCKFFIRYIKVKYGTATGEIQNMFLRQAIFEKQLNSFIDLPTEK